MAHTRKDTLVAPRQWWDHLRDWKKVTSKDERQAAKRAIRKELEERKKGE